MGERRASMIGRILCRIEDCIEEWRVQDKARHTKAEAGREAMRAEAAARERLLADAMGEEEARCGTVEEVVKEQHVDLVMHSEETARTGNLRGRGPDGRRSRRHRLENLRKRPS